MSRASLVALTLGTIALVAGGGGSSKMGSTSGGGLSSSVLVARGDAICARVHAAYHAHGYISTGSIAARAPIVSRDEQAAAREMRELKPPASLAHDWNTIISADKAIAADTAPNCGPAADVVKRAIRGPAVRASAAPSPGTSVDRQPGAGMA